MAARTPATPKRKGRGGLRILIALVVVIVLVAAGIVTLGVIASADTTVGAVLTTFVPDASVAHSGASFSSAASGTFVQPGDSVKTDAKGRAQIQFPDGTITRLANNTQIAINSSHFAKDGHVHDISVTDKLGRTLNSVQKLVGGATFQVVGNTTTASVRGTLFEVLVNGDGTVVIKLFIGGLDVDGKSGHVHLTEGQQVTVDANGNIGAPGPITPDPNDPFGQEVAAMQQVETQTTPGTEQDFTGGLLHNGQVQSFTYAFAAPSAGGSDFKAALAYPGSLMELRITDPANHVYTKPGPSPIVITIPDPPGGIFKLDVRFRPQQREDQHRRRHDRGSDHRRQRDVQRHRARRHVAAVRARRQHRCDPPGRIGVRLLDTAAASRPADRVSARSGSFQHQPRVPCRAVVHVSERADDRGSNRLVN